MLGFVHRIFRACSTWTHFHESMQKARTILKRNQYPPSFYDPIIWQTLKDIITTKTTPTNESSETETFAQTTNDIAQTSLDETPKRAIFIQYHSKCAEDYARTLHKWNAPCTIIMTLRKLKTTLPSLKPPVEKHLRSIVVYQIECAHCQTAYVSQTSRHLITRFKEHQKPSSPVSKHMKWCGASCTFDDATILTSTSRGEVHLLILEALYITELKPTINTKEEFRSWTLTIKFF